MFFNFGISAVLLLRRYYKIRTSFKTLVLKKTTIWRLKKSQINDNDKLFSNYHMRSKTSIKTSFIYNIRTGEESFCSCFCGGFVNRFDRDRVKNLEVYFVLYESSLLL